MEILWNAFEILCPLQAKPAAHLDWIDTTPDESQLRKGNLLTRNIRKVFKYTRLENMTPSAMYLHNDFWNQNALIFWDACAYPTSSLAGGYVSSRPGLPCWALNKNVVCGFKRKQQTCCWVLGCLGCTRITVWSSVRAFSCFQQIEVRGDTELNILWPLRKDFQKSVDDESGHAPAFPRYGSVKILHLQLPWTCHVKRKLSVFVQAALSRDESPTEGFCRAACSRRRLKIKSVARLSGKWRRICTILWASWTGFQLASW